jgi:hypothetical protein
MTNAPQDTAAVKPARKKSEKRQRQKQVKIRLLENEFNAVAAKAAQSGMSFGAYVRAAAVGEAGPRAQRRLPVDAQLVRLGLAQLGKYGNNMNQIAYQLNAHGETGLEADFRAALHEWGEIRDAMLAALGKDVAGGPAAE